MRQLPALLAAALLSATLFAGCATLRPQTGDVSFRLLWSGKADLDLHVVDPGGGHVGLPYLAAAAQDSERYAALIAEWQARQAPLDGETVGILDIDCNADVTHVCREPIENIFWPLGQAPRGDYRVWVELFQDVDKNAAVPYVLEIRRGEAVVRRLTGGVGPEQRSSAVTAYTY